jgi:hypothetical protein
VNGYQKVILSVAIAVIVLMAEKEVIGSKKIALWQLDITPPEYL